MIFLVYLKFIDNIIGFEGIIELSKSLKYVENLKELDIKSIIYLYIIDNYLGNKGIIILSQNLKYISNLTILNLHCI